MDATIFGIHIVTLALWVIAGMLAGTLFAGSGPVGFIGNVILGVAGGLAGGWATDRLGVNLADYVDGVSPDIATHLGSFLTALIGALVLLILLRILAPRRKG